MKPLFSVIAFSLILGFIEGERRALIGSQSSFPIPIFTEPVKNQTVVVGRDATLKCSVRNLGYYKVAWVRQDTHTLLSIGENMITRNYRLRVSSSGSTTWFLHISKATLEDRGSYMCQLNTAPMTSTMGYLQVVVPPNILDDESSDDVEVNEDVNAELRCVATGYPAPDVIFKREGGRKALRLGPSGGRTTSRNEVRDQNHVTIGTLSFGIVERQDMGFYLCIANNSVPPSVSKRMVLKVRYRDPDVMVSQQMLAAYGNDNITIKCQVTAYPKPIVFWQNTEGRMIISGGRFQVNDSQVQESPPTIIKTLFIFNLQPEDFTTYHCNASIDNDNSRTKSLQVQLQEIYRLSTKTPPRMYVNSGSYNAAPPRKNQRKTQANDVIPVTNKPAILSRPGRLLCILLYCILFISVFKKEIIQSSNVESSYEDAETANGRLAAPQYSAIIVPLLVCSLVSLM